MRSMTVALFVAAFFVNAVFAATNSTNSSTNTNTTVVKANTTNQVTNAFAGLQS